MSYRHVRAKMVIEQIEDDSSTNPPWSDDVDFWTVHKSWVEATKEHAPPSTLNRYAIWCMAHLASKAGL